MPRMRWPAMRAHPGVHLLWARLAVIAERPSKCIQLTARRNKDREERRQRVCDGRCRAWSRWRDVVARRKTTYNVYAIELSRDVLLHNKFVDANPFMRADKPCVYVGSTYLLSRRATSSISMATGRTGSLASTQSFPRRASTRTGRGMRLANWRKQRRSSERRVCEGAATLSGTASDYVLAQVSSGWPGGRLT